MGDIPNLYHQNDPNAPKWDHVWHYVYLHGLAEDHSLETVLLGRGADEESLSSPDLFVSDQPIPEEPGLHMARLYGKDVVVCLDNRRGYMCGRAAILTTEGDGLRHLQHALTPEDWR